MDVYFSELNSTKVIHAFCHSSLHIKSEWMFSFEFLCMLIRLPLSKALVSRYNLPYVGLCEALDLRYDTLPYDKWAILSTSLNDCHSTILLHIYTSFYSISTVERERCKKGSI